MRLYRRTYSDPDHGTCLSWHRSEADAKQAARIDRLEIGRHSSIEPVDVPTTKAGLLRWLNDNLDRANG